MSREVRALAPRYQLLASIVGALANCKDNQVEHPEHAQFLVR